MNKPLASSLALAALLSAVTVFGADATPKATPSGDSGLIGVSTVAAGRLPGPPKGKRPTMIPGSEKAPGFFVVKPKGLGRGSGDFVMLVATVAQAKEAALGRGFGGGETPANEFCFAEEQKNWGSDDEDEESAWAPSVQPQATFNSSTMNGRPRVEAVHQERRVQGAAGAVLESADAWIDPVTRGARLIARSTLPLTRVATILGGSVVYAGRDEHTVHVILTAPPDGDARRGTQVFAAVDGGIAASQCGYLRVPLANEKGQGHTATFVSNLELAPLNAQGKPVPKDLAKTSPQRLTPSLLGLPKDVDRPDNRFRPVHVHASVSWASRDKDALLSVTSGWDARERTQPF